MTQSGFAPSVFVFPLDVDEDTLRRARHLCLHDEIERSDRFRFARHARRFLTRRAMRRLVLADWISADPSEIHLLDTAAGKPELTDNDLFFNASHSDELGVVAVSAQPVGVDVESTGRSMDFEAFSRRSFTAEEYQQITADPNRLVDAFFACWTAKEAYIKGLGTGLGKGLKTFVVNADPSAPARLIRDEEFPAAPDEWQLVRFNVGESVVTLAVHGAAEPPTARYRRIDTAATLAARRIVDG